MAHSMTKEETLINLLTQVNDRLEEQKLLQKVIFTFEEACKYLDFQASYLYKLTSGRLIPHFCPSGKKLYFKRTELDEWLLQNRVPTTSEIKSKSFLK